MQKRPQQVQKAEKLWAKYEQESEAGFWPAYETLLEGIKKEATQKAITRQKEVAISQKNSATQVFKLPTSVYIFNVMLGLVGLLAPVGITMWLGATALPNAIIVNVIVYAFLLNLYATHYNQFIDFSVDDQHFYIHRPFLFSVKPIELAQINYAELDNQPTGRSRTITQVLKLGLTLYQTRTYKLKLHKTQRDQLLQALEARKIATRRLRA